MDELVTNISSAIENTCKVPLVPTLTNLATKQGGFLQKRLLKQWKKELTIYHSTIKAINTTTHDPNWLIHPNITNIQKYNNIPVPPTNSILK
jgi:hypothetical protein